MEGQQRGSSGAGADEFRGLSRVDLGEVEDVIPVLGCRW